MKYRSQLLCLLFLASTARAQPGAQIDAEIARLKSGERQVVDGGQPVPLHPYVIGNPEHGQPFVADAFKLTGALDSSPTVVGKWIKSYRGRAITSKVAYSARGNLIERCHTALHAPTSDCVWIGNEGRNCRDYGGHVAVGAGNTQSFFQHFFGHTKALFNEGGLGFRGIGDTYADAYWGWDGPDGNSSLATLTACMVQHNVYVGINMGGSRNSIEGGTRIYVPKTHANLKSPFGPKIIGVRWFSPDPANPASGNQMLGGGVELVDFTWGGTSGHTGSIGFQISTNDNTIDTQLTDNDKLANGGAIGVQFIGPVKGNRVTFTTYGFHGAADRIPTFDNAGIKANVILIRGENVDTKNPEKYVDIPAGWDDTNSIQLVNTTTGESVKLKAGKAY